MMLLCMKPLVCMSLVFIKEISLGLYCVIVI